MSQLEVNRVNKKKYKLYRKKKFIATLIATATLFGTGSIFYIRKENDKINSNKEYSIGYEDIGLLNGITNRVSDTNFVLMDIGDHDSIGVLFQEQKLDYCVKNGIDIGLMLNSNSSSLVDIYFDLEYLMGILEDYKVSYPVYLNIDSIFNNEKLTLDDSKELVDAFLKKACENNIYIGICGSKDNILEEYSKYDLLVKDSNVKKGCIFKKNGIYYADLGLKENLEMYSYNNHGCFKQDEYHIVESDETLMEIARQYGVSVYDLKRYNNIFSNKIEVGDILRVPSSVFNIGNHLNSNGKYAKVGIDVSLWQGEVDWDTLDIDYAIIQVRDFANLKNDPQFEANVNGCLQNGIPIGFYAFSRATSREEVQAEAKYLISQISGIPVTYPIYLDLETDFWDSLLETDRLNNGNYSVEESKEYVLDFIKTWEREILKAGFIPGIYCNYSLYDKLNLVTDNYLENMDCWIAGGKYYDQEISYGSEEMPIIDLDENEVIAMKQFTSVGKINGISSSIDLNYCYTDYENKYDWERKKFSKLGSKFTNCLPFLVIGGVIYKFKRRKNKRRTKGNL